MQYTRYSGHVGLADLGHVMVHGVGLYGWLVSGLGLFLLNVGTELNSIDFIEFVNDLMRF